MRWIAYRIALGTVGLLALPVGLAALGLGIFMAFGSPIPTAWPSGQEVWAALTQGAMTQSDMRRLLAIAFFLLLAHTARVAIAEVSATLGGRSARRVRFAGPIQPVVAQLVAWCAIALMPMTPRPASGHVQSPPALAAVLAGARSPAASLSPAAPVGAASPDSVWVVKPGDNASLIAERTMHSQRRWPLLWLRDRGIREPDGRRWTNPDLIYPGWRLPLPPGAELPEEANTSSPNGSHPTPSGTAPSGGISAPAVPPPTLQPLEPARPPVYRPPVAPNTDHPPPAPQHQGQQACPAPITLPSGGVVPLALASALAGAVALARLQRRRRFRPVEPGPLLDREPAPEPFMTATVKHVLRRLHAAKRAVTEDDEGEPTGAAWVVPGDDRRPGEVVLGHRGDEPVLVDLLAHPGVALAGEGAVAAARAVALQVIAEGQRGRADVVAIGEPAAAVLSGVEDVPNASIQRDALDGLTHVEIELMGRRRTVEEADAADFRTFIASQPYEPMPLLLVVASASVEPERLASLLAAGAPLGIIGIVLCADTAEWPAGAVTVGSAGELQTLGGTVTGELAGVKLVSMSEDEARECLSLIAMSTGSRAIPEPGDAAAAPAASAITDVAAIAADAELPARTDQRDAAEQDAHVTLMGVRETGTQQSSAAVPVRARLFGAYHIQVLGQEVRTGLRRSARELFAYLLLHPDGVRPQVAIDDLWPSLDEQRGAEQFRTAIRNLRQVLRDLTGVPLPKFIEHRAERYAVDTELIGADVLDMHRAQCVLDKAAADDATREAALGQILDSYGGELLDGTTYLWAEPYREELRQRAVAAALRLAELRSTISAEAALPVLERAARLSPYAEDVYCALMVAQARAGHTDMVRTTLRTLEHHLAELDAEPEAATVALAERLSRWEPHLIVGANPQSNQGENP